jgi:multidrug efflux pump subunit AcrA (membrane-fusion protein)
VFSDTAIGETIEGLVVVLVDQADVVAHVEGPITSIVVVEGQSIDADDLVARIDDQSLQIQLSLIEQEVKIADALAARTHAIAAAQSAVNQQRHKLEEHAVRSEIDRQKAGNELSVAAAEKSEAVAMNEWNRAKDARGKFADAVSDSEVESLRLAYERSRLETREAKFEQGIAKLAVELNETIAAVLQTQLDFALIGVEEAESAQRVLEMEATKTRLQLKSAEVDLEGRRLRSPISGQVVSVTRRMGDWVSAGDVLARVIGMRRLRVEGFVPAANAQQLSEESTVDLEVTSPSGETKRFSAGARFVSPEVDAVTLEVRLWFEFENVDDFAKPGYQASLIWGND